MALLEKHQEDLHHNSKKQQIAKATQHEKRLQFHTEAFMSAYDISLPVTRFLDWVKTLLPKDKYLVFVSLFQFPSPNVELVSKIYEQLERVFDGKNPAENYRFTSSELRDDWEHYREHVLKQPDIWRTKGWEMMKTSINSILVVDLPTEQNSQRPEPYFYWLDIENVKHYEMYENKLTSLIFHETEEILVIIDDEFYRRILVDKKGKFIETLVETPHELGYCPAQFFWTDSVSQSQKDLKKAPISPQLSNLDWLLFYSISKRHLDLYASYPIYWGYEEDCDFENEENGDYCDGGFLRGQNEQYKVLRDGVIERCPVCAEKKLSGAGSFVEIPVPSEKEDITDLRDPVGIITIDSTSLEYNVEEVKRLYKQIEDSVVGSGSTAQETQAINKDQVSANYSLKTNILNNIKGNLENAITFVNNTCAKLRYGNAFLGSYYSLGTEFYIYSATDLQNLFKLAKENGSSEAELDLISDEIISTQFKNDPQTMRRLNILRHLEPYRHLTKQEIKDLRSEGLLDDELLKLKINFTNFIDKFERENINILEFGSQIEFNKKISIINETLKGYVREQTSSVQT